MNYIRPDAFYPCLWEFLEEDIGSRYENDFVFNGPIKGSDTKIIGYRFTGTSIEIKSLALDGTQLLRDIRNIENTYGLPGTFSYA